MQFSESLIATAASIFEAANGRTLDDWENSEIERHGLRGVDLNWLSGELMRWIVSEEKDVLPVRAVAYWALGKKFDSSLLPFFRKQLAVELARDTHAVYQIMIALDNLNERVFSDGRGGSYSSDEHELNSSDSARYLEAEFTARQTKD